MMAGKLGEFGVGDCVLQWTDQLQCPLHWTLMTVEVQREIQWLL